MVQKGEVVDEYDMSLGIDGCDVAYGHEHARHPLVWSSWSS
jgi:hypothetical protein